MKKSIALLLCILMLLPLAVSCSNNSQTGGTETAPTQTGTVTPTAAENVDDENLTDYERRQLIPDDLPDVKFDGKIFRVLTTSDGYGGKIIKRDEIVVDELNGDACNDAVYNRNINIEERFGIKIECETDDNPQTYVNTLVTSGTNDYQLVGFYNYLAASAISAGSLLNWHEVPNVNLDKPWHNSLANDNATIFGKLFAICSDLSITSMTYTYGIFANIPMLDDVGFKTSDIYGTVTEGKWTIDYFTSIVADMYQDKNGDGKQDKDDIYGFGYEVTNPADVWLAAFDQPLTQPDPEKGITVTFMTDKTVAAIEKMIDFHYNNPGEFTYPSQYDEETYFLNSKLVFAPLRFYTAYNVLREMEDPYTIVPWPKWDEAQETYYTNADDKFTAFGLPLTVYSDLDYVTVIYEALCAESYKKVYPEYYDTALKGKYSAERETAEMVDLIMEGRAFDVAFEFSGTLSDLPYLFRKQIQSGSPNIASKYKSIEKSLSKNAPKQINKMYGGD
ncbi:MAG: hypothetical protein IKQ92_15220 [Clostridia bacterium]|nr:hypothetical protein [Clostridia bacterium]